MTLPIPLPPPVTMATLSASLPNSLPPVCSPTALTGVHPTVHRDGLCRDKRIADDRQDGFRDLLRATQPPNGNASGELPARLIIARQRLPTLDERGGHGVHRDPVGCERTGQCVHEADKAGLRGRVMGTHDSAGESSDRGDKHHPPPLPPAHPGCEPFGEKEAGLRFTSITRSQSSTVISSRLCCGAMPALLISMSTDPSSASTVLIISSRAAGSLTSLPTATARCPIPEICVVCSSAAVLSLAYPTATSTPASARRLAMAAPIPRLAPVTKATRPLGSIDLPYKPE